MQAGITGPELERWLQARVSRGAPAAVVGACDGRWLRGDPVVRAGVDGVRPCGCHGHPNCGWRPARGLPARQGARDGRRPRSATGLPWQRGIVRHHHGGRAAVRPLPEKKVYEGMLFPTFDAGVRRFRQLAQDRVNADVMRLSDADESAVNLAGSGLSGLKKRAFDRYTPCARSTAGAWRSSGGRARRTWSPLGGATRTRCSAGSVGSGGQ